MEWHADDHRPYGEDVPTFTTSDGAQLNYQIEGNGPSTLAFVHGWCSNLRHWDPQATHFAKTHRVLRWDRRGSGGSVDAPAAKSAAHHADDLATLLDQNGIDQVTVLGHAGGSPCALEFAVRHSSRTNGVVIVDFGLAKKPNLDDPTDAFGTLLAQMVRTLKGPEGPAAFRNMYAGYFGPKCDPAISAAAINAAATTPIDVACSELIDVIAIDNEALVRQITAPVMWVTATTPDAAYLNSVIGNLSIGVTPGSGHFIQLEVPHQLNAMIETFLTQNS